MLLGENVLIINPSLALTPNNPKLHCSRQETVGSHGRSSQQSGRYTALGALQDSYLLLDHCTGCLALTVSLDSARAHAEDHNPA